MCKDINNKLKNIAIIVNTKEGFLETEKFLLENGLKWYGLYGEIFNRENTIDKFSHFFDNDSKLKNWELLGHNALIIPVSSFIGINGKEGMTLSTINNIPFLVKDRGIKKIIHYQDLQKYVQGENIDNF